MTFNVGSAMKYLWRAGLKGDALEDLMKAHWYVVREIGRLERGRIEESLTRRMQEHLATFQRPAESVPEPPAERAEEQGGFRKRR